MRLIAVWITCSDPAAARSIAAALIEGRLAACAHLEPEVESTYRWRGRVETARETPLRVTTRAGLFDRVAQAVRALHPYETPAIVAHPLEGTSDYAAWAYAETVEP